jgi:pyruvate dehydrogenase E2 component (dihydrolipoamide acetyltransferase)|tara:strand:- start:2135 stop:3376 length:1242 start_codon:yes stop_codon:yes gene_type:complete
MALEFKFPDVGEGITEGTIVKWNVKEGDSVKADQKIADVETDKAVVEIPSPKKGTILKLYHKEGEVINVGEVIAVIGDKGEKVPEKSKEEKRYTGSVVGFLPEAEDEKPAEKKKKVTKSTGDKVKAAPIVRKLARMMDIDLSTITGTGPEGRITEDDVKASVAPVKKEVKTSGGMKKVKKYDFYGYVDHVPLKGIRKITAEKMREAVNNAALVTNHDHVDVTELANVRKKEKEKAAKKKIHLTYLPFIVKATLKAIKKHPYVASSVEGDEIIVKKYYNIGVAIDTPNGLIVPVIKGVDQKKLYDLANEVNNFVEKAKSRKIDLMDLKGGIFTITNIGVIGSTYFTPIVNYPETCILGTGRIEDKVVVINGKMEIRKIMPISFTYDHRVLDGAEAARFMNDLKALLEKPGSLVD